jgi:hypothetical protein
MAVFVRCRSTGTASVDQGFAAVLTDRTGLKVLGGGPAAYVVADRPKADAYTPATRRFSTAGKPPSIVRLGTGRWVVTLKGMPLAGAAFVTPLTDGPALCSISGIRREGPPQRVGVVCFAADGSPRDVAFSLTYLR